VTGHARPLLWRALLPLGLALITICYMVSAVQVSATRLLWIDEVLAVMSARLPTAADVRDALWKGSEFTPWTFNLILHPLLRGLGPGDGLLLARVPSIAAVLGAAICMFMLVRRHLGSAPAMVAFGVVLAGALFGYAVQARPYALLAFGAALAILAWDGIAIGRRSSNGWLLAAALAFSVSMHFYGVLVPAAVGFMELLWLVTRRRVRAAVWIPLVVAGVVLLFWVPLAQHYGTFIKSDVGTAATYYARPRLSAARAVLLTILADGPPGTVLLLAGAATAGALALIGRRPDVAGFVDRWIGDAPTRSRDVGLGSLEIIMLALAMLPIIGFALAVLAVGSFQPRYVIPAALLPPLLAGYLAARVRPVRGFALAFAVVIAAMLLIKGRALNDDPSKRGEATAQVLAAVEALPGREPIVVGDGTLFVELYEAADRATRSRLLFPLPPSGVATEDTTALHQVERLATFLPGYPNVPTGSILTRYPRFYLVYQPSPFDGVGPWLISSGRVGAPIDATARIFLAGNSQSAAARLNRPLSTIGTGLLQRGH